MPLLQHLAELCRLRTLSLLLPPVGAHSSGSCQIPPAVLLLLQGRRHSRAGLEELLLQELMQQQGEGQGQGQGIPSAAAAAVGLGQGTWG
ncbi:hypothetical protein V8C86DRAFT_2976150 [Haematococcus lacustris]